VQPSVQIVHIPRVVPNSAPPAAPVTTTTTTGGGLSADDLKRIDECMANALMNERWLEAKPTVLPLPGELGLFAKRDFKAGDFLVQYRGEECTKQQIDERYGDQTAKYAAPAGFVLVDEVKQPVIIDAADKTKSSVARYANDCTVQTLSYMRSKGLPVPQNLRVNAAFVVLKPGKLYLRAILPIADKSEIFVSYGAEYWGSLNDQILESLIDALYSVNSPNPPLPVIQSSAIVQPTDVQSSAVAAPVPSTTLQPAHLSSSVSLTPNALQIQPTGPPSSIPPTILPAARSTGITAPVQSGILSGAGITVKSAAVLSQEAPTPDGAHVNGIVGGVGGAGLTIAQLVERVEERVRVHAGNAALTRDEVTQLVIGVLRTETAKSRAKATICVRDKKAAVLKRAYYLSDRTAQRISRNRAELMPSNIPLTVHTRSSPGDRSLGPRVHRLMGNTDI
jgi:hypothetical protein